LLFINIVDFKCKSTDDQLVIIAFLKVLNRKNAEIEELKIHSLEKDKDYEDIKQRLERKGEMFEVASCMFLFVMPLEDFSLHEV